MVGRHVGEEAVLWMWGLGGQGLCWLAHTSPLLSGASQAVYTVHQLSCSPVLSVLTWVVAQYVNCAAANLALTRECTIASDQYTL